VSRITWLTHAGADLETWRARCQELQADVYHYPEYGLLYREEGEPCCALYESAAGTVLYPFIVRSIGSRDAPASLVDLCSPYGYGGPVVRSSGGASEEALFAEFLTAFDSTCAEHRVVSEFVRLHPLIENASLYATEDLYSHHDTVAIDLTQSESELWRGIRKGHKSSIKKASRVGVDVVLAGVDSLSDFTELYRQTMERQEADESYRFADAFFRETLDGLGEAALVAAASLSGRVVSAAMFLVRPPYAHYHFSGASREGLDSCANHALLHRVTLEMKARGCQMLHLGGGLSPEDSLYRFKGGFSPLRLPFLTARRIHNRVLYDQLAEERLADAGKGGLRDESFFPLYRAPLSS